MIVTTWGPLPTSNGYKPGALLNILECRGQPPTSKNYQAQNGHSPEVGLEDTGPGLSSTPGGEPSISLLK